MKELFLFLSILVVVGCSPKLNYLGDSYAPSDHVDVFYDEGDIDKEYRVMGQLTADNADNVFIELNTIRDKMIVEAKNRGADAILFLHHDSFQDQHIVQSKLLKYK